VYWAFDSSWRLFPAIVAVGWLDFLLNRIRPSYVGPGIYGLDPEKRKKILGEKDWAGLITSEKDYSNKSFLFSTYFTLMLCERKLHPPVVVGGHAATFYSPEYVTTDDIDFVVPDKKEGEKLLVELGFSRGQRIWIHSAMNVYVEIVGDLLTGSYDRIRSFTVYRVPVAVLGPEDIIVTRLVMGKHWNVHQVIPYASEIYNGWAAKLDQSYLMSLAREQHVDDLLQQIRDQKSS
jgi:hypothetical protein